MFNRDVRGRKTAATSPAWRPVILQSRLGIFPVMITSKAEDLSAASSAELLEFVDARTADALKNSICRPLAELLPTYPLERVLSGSDAMRKRLESTVRQYSLPCGPTHGDLHRGNLLRHKGAIAVIDFDRFREAGCPLFDNVHLHLSEKQREVGGRWLDVLCAHPELVAQAAMGWHDQEALFMGYALQRISHESEAAFLQGRSLEKYRRQFEKLMSTQLAM